jgi:SAM-dependent methyltransferase
MSLDFAADWLSLREPADHAARAPALTDAAVVHLAATRAPLVVDLGCGRGSNLALLGGQAPASTRWRLVDRDPALLAAARTRLRPEVKAELVAADLRAADLGELLAGARLVTAGALLDLVDRSWLQRLVDAAGRNGAALLATGNVDGRIAWQPALTDDAPMIEAFLAHHGGDKGFGMALGSEAPAVLETLLEERGWAVKAARADWDLDARSAGLQAAYLDGAVAAIGETGVDASRLQAWADARGRAIADGASRLRVGHVDVFGMPPSAP